MRRRIIPGRARRAARRARTRFSYELAAVTRRAFIPKLLAQFVNATPALSVALNTHGPVMIWSAPSDPYTWGADDDIAGADDALARAAFNAREKAQLVGRLRAEGAATEGSAS